MQFSITCDKEIKVLHIEFAECAATGVVTTSGMNTSQSTIATPTVQTSNLDYESLAAMKPVSLGDGNGGVQPVDAQSFQVPEQSSERETKVSSLMNEQF